MSEMNLKQAYNRVAVVGQINEINLREGVSRDQKPYIAGNIIVKVARQDVEGELKDLEIRHNIFSWKYLKSDPSKLSKKYLGFKELMDTGQSIAAVGAENADWVDIAGSISENRFYDEGRGQWANVFGPGINLDFIKNFKQSKPQGVKADFTVVGVIGSTVEKMDYEGVPFNPPKFETKLIVPGYANRVDVINLISRREVIRDHFEENKDSTMQVAGIVNFSFEEIVRTTEMAVGDPLENVYTRSVSELVVTSASAPFVGEAEYDLGQIKVGLADRQAYMDAEGERRKAQAATPAPVAADSEKGITIDDLGF